MTTVTLYIEPDKGPIKPVQLDLLDIEQLLQTAYTTSRNRDQERLKLICTQIKRQLPNVQPESNMTGLSLVMARFSHADQFNGCVLHLTGEIEADPIKPASNGQAPSLKNEVDRLTREVRDLRGQLLNEQRANMSDKARALQLEATNQQLSQQRMKDYNEIAQLEQQIQQNKQELQRERDEHARELLRLQTDVETAVRTGAGIKTQYEQLEVQLKTQYEQLKMQYEDVQKRLQQREGELATLRLRDTEAKEAEDQFRTTIADQKKQIDDLRQRLRLITEGTSIDSAAQQQAGTSLLDDMLA